MPGVEGREGGRGGEGLLNGVSFPCGVMRMFWNKIEAVVAQHFECTKHPSIAHFLMVKIVNFMLYGFYHIFKKGYFRIWCYEAN